MGQLTLFFVIAAFFVSGIVVFNAAQSADRTDEKVWEHQYRVLARDVAATGMSATLRKMGLSTLDGFNTHPDYPFTVDDVEYEGGTYSILGLPNQCSLLPAASIDDIVAADSGFDPSDSEWLEVRSTGTYNATVGTTTTHRHQIRTCFVRTKWGLFSNPAFNFGFVSGGDATFNGGTATSLVDGEGHVHTNSDLTVRPNTTIQGVLTHTGDSDVHKNAETGEVEYASPITLPPFSAEDYANENNIPLACNDPDVCLYGMPDLETLTTNENGAYIIKPPTPDAGHRYDNPFVWYLPDGFNLSGGDHIMVPQYTVIVVNGNITLSGGSSITATGTKAPTCDCPEQQQAWVESQLLNGEHTPLTFFGTNDVSITGSASVVGNFYVNGDVTLNGGGQGMNSVGSFVARGELTVNGGGGATKTNFWFTEISPNNEVDSVMLPGYRIVRLASTEWTEPLLPNAN